jgi:hypothetical protein
MQLDLSGSGESVPRADGKAEHLASHESLAEPLRIRRHRPEPEIALPAQQEIGHIGAVDLARADLELGVALARALQERGSGVPCRGQRVDEAQGAGLAARSRLHPPHGAIRGGEHALRIRQEDRPSRRQLHLARAAPQQRDGERRLECTDLLAHRLLGHVQLSAARVKLPCSATATK